MSLDVEHVPEEQVYLDGVAAVFTPDGLPEEEVQAIGYVEVPPKEEFMGETDQETPLVFFFQGREVGIILIVGFGVTTRGVAKAVKVVS